MNCETALEETKLKELKSNSLSKLLFPFLSVAFRSTEDARNCCIRMSAKCGPEKFAFVNHIPHSSCFACALDDDLSENKM